ncbi:MAG: hypothetical protein JWM91_4430 [Rhodospirillales bacterium]|nr:hypothetical protein [Rhodospirillales bacterium]
MNDVQGLLAMIAISTAFAAPAWAQAGKADQAQGATACANRRAEPATPQSRGAGSGTAPGNSGNTAWTGGKSPGTSDNGASSGSQTWQPKTAQGLDPLKPMPQGDSKSAC